MLSFTRRRALFLRYTSLPRVGRVLSVEGKEEDIYIYVQCLVRFSKLLEIVLS